MDEGRAEFFNVFDSVLKGHGFSHVVAYAIRFFLRNPYETLVVTNRRGKLEYMDRISEKYFGLSEGGAIGRDIKDFVPDSDVPRVLSTGIPFLGNVIEVKGNQRLGATYPLIRDGEVIGAVAHAFFRPFEEIERTHREMGELRSQIRALHDRQRSDYQAYYSFDNILGVSSELNDAIEMARKIAMVETDVLITGESGTGKELFAQAIHNSNPNRPFVCVNSPSIPFELAESELFGYEKGAFSGASSTGKQGKFELAAGGTIFLDELSSLPLSIQAKILRVLQDREIEKLGSTRRKKVNFRVIAATNQRLEKLVAEGRFREDLYYRINRANITIPPLRQRKEDIPLYVSHFLKKINSKLNTHFEGLSEDALGCFMNYSWPGNVRQLINVLEQACLKKWVGETIPRNCLSRELIDAYSPCTPEPASMEFKAEVKEKERMLIQAALNRTNGNKRKAAKLLGIPRSTLYKKLNGGGTEI